MKKLLVGIFCLITFFAIGSKNVNAEVNKKTATSIAKNEIRKELKENFNVQIKNKDIKVNKIEKYPTYTTKVYAKEMKNSWSIEASAKDKPVSMIINIKSKKNKVTNSLTYNNVQTFNYIRNEITPTGSLASSLDSFDNLTNTYASLPKQERSTDWDGIKGARVTFQGNIVEVGGNRIYVIRSDKYTDGMTWDSIVGTPNEYYAFVAQFANKINKSAFIVGAPETVSGYLDSRGDPDFVSHWKLYEVVRGQ